MAVAMLRFVSSSSTRDAGVPFSRREAMVATLGSEFGMLNKSYSSTHHSIFLRQGGVTGRCSAELDRGQGSTSSTSTSTSGIWDSFSEFFQRVVVSADTPSSSSGYHLPKSDLPLLQVCPRTVPVPHDTDTVDDVLSQLLYAGFGNLTSTLDGLFSLIFPGTSMEDATKPAAELCASSARCITAQDLGSLEAFHAWLQERLPEGGNHLGLWGTAPGTKRVANLWRELLEGEISMEDSRPPKRTVHVASVRIRNEAGQMLVEAFQEMADGRIRPRNRPLSEKMKPGEKVEEACLRGIVEELGEAMGSSDKVVLVRESYARQEEERESFSYPGLPTRYVIHTMDARVQQLPSSDFDTQEDEDAGDTMVSGTGMGTTGVGSTVNCAAVGVRKHFWKWV